MLNDATQRRVRLGILIALYLGLGAAHLLASPHAHRVHDFLFKVTYLQIILAALWFGWRGGLLMSGATSLLYLFHIFLQLRGHREHDPVTLMVELLLYNVIAVITGVLTEREIHARRALESTSRDLEASYLRLQEKTRELLSAEDQLRSSDRLRTAGELAASMAHEVRNPLGGILGASEILARPGTTAEAREEFASVLRKEITRLDRVIGDFLDYARPGRAGIAESTLDEVVDASLRLLAPTIERQRIVVTREGRSDLRVAADSGQVQQVMMNLLLNAAQAMPNGGKLVIAHCAEAGFARLRVTDTGGGIAPELQGRVFEPFLSTRAGGSGLGLPISSRIAEGWGGHLRLIASDREGSTFELALPLIAPSSGS